MSSISKISKLIAVSLLVVMLYAHVCSVWCAVGMARYERMTASQKEHCNKTCCKESKNLESKSNDCQEGHLAFFSVTGQFLSNVNDDLAKPFQVIAAIVTPQLSFPSSEIHQTITLYNGFHPPPPNRDIRISIQSFQI